MAVDWLKIKTEYETTDISQRKLAEKYNVSYPTLRDRSKREEWLKSKEKTRSKIVAKTSQKAIEKIVDRNTRFLNISDMALDVIEEYLKDKKYMKHLIKYKNYADGRIESEELVAELLDIPDTKAFSNMITSLDKIQKGQRLGEGLDIDKDEDTTIIVKTNIPRGEPDGD